MSESHRTWAFIAAAAAIAGIADLALLLSGHEASDIIGGTWVEFWPAFAVVWNLVIIGLAKFVLGPWLQRRHDYYESNGDE